MSTETETQDDVRVRRTKAGAKKRNKTKAARKRRQAKSPPPKRERIRARRKIERFEVDPALAWIVVRSEPTKALKCAQALRERGLPVFEARYEERLVADNGKARVARTPILRRLMFVGSDPCAESLPFAPGAYLQDVLCRGEGCHLWLEPERVGGVEPMRFSAIAMQRFADHVTGHLVKDEEVGEVFEALFAIGQEVRVAAGPYASFRAVIEEFITKTSRYKASVHIFGRATSLEFDEDQLEAA